MTRPEDAAERARAEAAERDYRERPGPEARALEDGVKPIDPELLRELAMVEVDPAVLYSTQRFGAPVTAVKRLIFRLMRQYTAELEARQTRFNVAVLARLRELEERVEAAERERG